MYYNFLKLIVGNFDFSDRELVNITSKSYLLATRLICSATSFSYGIKSFGVSKFWLFSDLLLDNKDKQISFLIVNKKGF